MAKAGGGSASARGYSVIRREVGATYGELRERYRWLLPRTFNMGVACSDWQRADDLALLEVTDDGAREYTFGQLSSLSNRFANALRGLGVRDGDRVGILLPQRVETGVAHLALYKLGAIAIPMSILFGPLALSYRLGDADARIVITDTERAEAVAEVARDLPGLQLIVVDGDRKGAAPRFWPLIEDASPAFTAVATEPGTPGLLIYTSGTTGAPKGALHGHRVLLGHLPGFQLSHNYFPQAHDRFWTPADWAWIGGLMDALMPTWYFGRPVVASARQRFDPDWALSMMTQHEVRNAFLPPTVLKMMRQAGSAGRRLELRSLMCGGEPLGEEMLDWACEHLGVVVNEIYGQTEANYVVGNCAETWPVMPGSMGLPYPGHEVVVLAADGAEAAPGEHGEVAVAVDDPVVFLEYWKRPEATRAKLSADGRWLMTGDLARRDGDGYLWFQSRSDDVITSAGYRIGPAEIEECLLSHPAVAMAGAFGVPDEIRGEAVKAVIQLAEGHAQSPELEQSIREHVRHRLAAYEYPRHLEFVDRLPLTTTGKIQRNVLRERDAARRGWRGGSAVAPR